MNKRALKMRAGIQTSGGVSPAADTAAGYLPDAPPTRKTNFQTASKY